MSHTAIVEVITTSLSVTAMLSYACLSLALLLSANVKAHGDVDPDTPDNYISQHVSLVLVSVRIINSLTLDGVRAPYKWF